MTIHPLPPFGDRAPDENADDCEACDDCDEFGNVDDLDDCDLEFDDRSDDAAECDLRCDDQFDDADETTNRFGGLDSSSTLAHRVVTPPLLAGLTGVALPICQAFHHILFSMLEYVGDYDGLVVAPPVCIGPRSERFGDAARWVADHPAPDVGAIWAEINTDDDPDAACDELQATVTTTLSNHSLGLSLAAGSNPSLTFGSADALTDRILDELFEVPVSWCGDEIARLTDIAVALIGCGADVVRLIGGAQVQVVDPDGSSLPRSGRPN